MAKLSADSEVAVKIGGGAVTEFLKSLIQPSNMAIVFFLIGLLLLAFRRWRHVSCSALVISGLIFIVFSSGKVAAFLLAPLEYRYPMLLDPAAHPNASAIVVLTGYAAQDPEIPLSSQCNSASVYRLLEAYRIYRERPSLRIILSGTHPATAIMKQLLVTLGVPEAGIQEDSHSAHTYLSGRNLARQLDNEEFFLVTSAGHMPRAIGVFLSQNLNAIPAPTDYQLPRDVNKASPYPSSHQLYFSDLATREYAGILWYRLTGLITTY